MPEPTSYRTVAGPVEAEIEVKRSRFLCLVAPVSTEVEARAIIDQQRKQHWDAGHHCSAFVLGTDRGTERSSDDGEPSGTAGAPMLDVLRGRELTDLVAVVSRWFGGTLLGAGGLVRAYGDAVRTVLEAATITTHDLALEHHLGLSHAIAGRVESELRTRGFTIVAAHHAANVTLTVSAAPEQTAALEASVAELTGGQAQLVSAGQSWVTRSSR